MKSRKNQLTVRLEDIIKLFRFEITKRYRDSKDYLWPSLLYNYNILY